MNVLFRQRYFSTFVHAMSQFPKLFNITSKNRFIFRLILLFCLIASVTYVGINVIEFRTEPKTEVNSQQLTENADESLVYECCTPQNSSFRKNLFFLKTHKTASSTVQNVLLRFALRHSLDIMCIPYSAYYFPITDLSIPLQTRTFNNKYNIFAHHVIYDYQRLKKYQYPDTKLITIMRNPAKLFKSMYDFFLLNITTGMKLPEFINSTKKPDSFFIIGSWFAYVGYNAMSFDLGFDLQRNSKNQTAIDEFVEKLDREFDFVLIADHMEASFILLANLMGWPLEYVSHLMINKTPRDSGNTYTLTPHDELVLMDLNPVDTRIYNHFLKKFLKCVDQYGEERLQQQIIQLRIMNEKLKNRCVGGTTRHFLLNSLDYVPKNGSDLECKYALSDEMEMEDITTKEQTKKSRRNSGAKRSS